MKILFIDDDDMRHNSMAGSCGTRNFDLTHAFTVQQAIKLLQEEQFDWIFLDFDMNDHQYVSELDGMKLNGGDIAIFICSDENVRSNPTRGIVIHSHNEAGAINMSSLLRGRNFQLYRWEFMSSENPFRWEVL